LVESSVVSNPYFSRSQPRRGKPCMRPEAKKHLFRGGLPPPLSGDLPQQPQLPRQRAQRDLDALRVRPSVTP
jgi:hypothetical protein